MNVEHYQRQTRLAVHSRCEAFELAFESTWQSDTLETFRLIADTDGRLGTVCEFICAGLPLTTVRVNPNAQRFHS